MRIGLSLPAWKSHSPKSTRWPLSEIGSPTPPSTTAPHSLDYDEVLASLYARQTALASDAYLEQHADPRFIAGQVNVFQWYRQFLPASGSLLDWGCRHAPDSCLIRTAYGDQFEHHACDLPPAGQYRIFHDYAGVEYQQLTDAVELPYESNRFDTIVASGVLEHVAMDYESLKELYRVMKVGGRLMITYLPNRLSWREWRARRTRQLAHRRLYSLRLIRELLLRTGFYPERIGYQTKSDQLSKITWKDQVIQPMTRVLQIHRLLATCLCVVATKVDCM